MKTFEELYQLIEKNFQWDKVLKTMIALNWKWHHRNALIVPSLKRIKSTAYNLLKQAYEDKTSCGSGGFRAGYEDGELWLEFVVEDIQTGDLYI